MKRNRKLLIFPVLAVVLLVIFVITMIPKMKKNAQKASGENGVLYTDYFTGNAASEDWLVGWSEAIAAPEPVQDGLHFSGSGTKPCAAMLDYELPEKFDMYFSMDIRERGGDSRDPGVFFCVGKDYEQRYTVVFSEEKILLKHNGITDVVVKKAEGLKGGVAYAVHIAVDGAKLQVYLDGAEEPCMTFNASGDYADFADAKTFGVVSYAKDFCFDNLVITNGTDFLPITGMDITGKDGEKVIRGLGNTLQMEMFINPSNATDCALVWSVDNDAIADISQDGLITAKGYGEVTVSARTRDGSDISVSKKLRIVFGDDQNRKSFLSTNRKTLLAENGIPVFEGKEPDVCVLGSGRILVSGENGNAENPGRVAYSDDEGKTWTTVFEGSIRSGRIFEVEDMVYLMGEDSASADLILYVSEDEGKTWSDKHVLDTRNWSAAPSEVIVRGNSIYLTMEVQSEAAVKRGYTGNAALSPILMKAEMGSDLTKAESWKFSSELAYADIMKDGTANAVDYVDVPNNYGDSTSVGWSGGNLFQIYDERLAWYDEDMKTFYIYLHGNEGVQGYALLLKVTEDRGKMTPSLVETIQSGKKLLFVPMPGGNQKFHIIYDEITGLYWQVSNYLNEKGKVALYFSKDAYDWCFAGMVAKTENETGDSPSMAIDGDDLLVVTNQITLYRIEDFRSYVY